jgi:peptidyl-tRNA hydrolase
VLSDFTFDEKAVIREVCQTAADAVGCLISQGVTAAMTRYN